MSYFINTYREITNQHNDLIHKAKLYVVANWEKVQDWSDLSILLFNRNTTNNKNKSNQEWFCKKASKTVTRLGCGVNPIKTLEIIYDESDSDTSVTVNGKEFWWVPGSNVIDIADYIEKYLNKGK